VTTRGRKRPNCETGGKKAGKGGEEGTEGEIQKGKGSTSDAYERGIIKWGSTIHTRQERKTT